MINAEFYIDEDGARINFKLAGHAGAGSYGSDIVCAAASILCYTLAQSLINLYNDCILEKEPCISLEAGAADISCEYSDTVYKAFIFAQTGFYLLAKDYGRYVSLKQFA